MNKNIKYGLIISFAIIGLTIMLTVFSTDSAKKELLNGLVVTDKANRSYVLEYKAFGGFNVKEFDIVNMRIKN